MTKKTSLLTLKRCCFFSCAFGKFFFHYFCLYCNTCKC